MTYARAQLISLDVTPYYHCISRCVRRAWLCGDDRYSGKNFDHRKSWVVERLKLLSEVFAIDIAAYAVMSNHYHVVLHVDVDQCKALSDDQVIRNWTRIYRGPELVRRYKAGDKLTKAETGLLGKIVVRWRKRLISISWFMRCMNEHLARKANAEDGCKGRFWEGRFKSQALLDESALLSCMTYVDLNPVRAGIATDLEGSDFTSIQDRIRLIKAGLSEKTRLDNGRRPRLMPFADALDKLHGCASIPHTLHDYLELADWTGRVIRQDKRGYIEESRPELLSILDVSPSEWMILAVDIQKQAITMLNGLDRLSTLRTRKSRRLTA